MVVDVPAHPGGRGRAAAPSQREPGALASASRFLLDFAAYGGRRTVLTGAVMVAAALLEGVGLALIVPLLSLVTALGPSASGLRRQVGELLERLGAHSPLSQLAVLLGAFSVLMMVRAVVILRRDTLLAELQIGFVESRRARLAERLTAARWDQLIHISHTRITHVLGSEIQRINVAALVTTHSAVSLMMLLAQCILALVLAPAMAAIAFCLLALGAAGLGRVLSHSRSLGADLAVRNYSLLNITSRFLGGLKLAISQNLKPAFLQEFDSTLGQLGRRQVSYARQQSFIRLSVTTVSGVVGATLVLTGIGVFHLTAPVLITLLLVISRTSGPASQIQHDAQQFARALPAYDALKALEQDLAALTSDIATPAQTGPAPKGLIQFEDVSFRHVESSNGDVRGVSGVRLSIAPGEFIGVAGPSGGGKTTLADLLVGLYPPQEGRITVGGRPLEAETLAAWRDVVGYAAQDPFLFSDTIRRNLAWANPAASEPEMWRVLAVVGADGLVRSMELGLETVVGEQGLLVSGGERQRIALARALLRRPQLLVLDEATSAIDVASEQAILKALCSLPSRPTMLMIAHRPESLACCSRVLKLEHGRLSDEAGSPHSTPRKPIRRPRRAATLAPRA
jgi:ABC-type multidrug transport system fused ATPase/permease subunit